MSGILAGLGTGGREAGLPKVEEGGAIAAGVARGDAMRGADRSSLTGSAVRNRMAHRRCAVV